MIQTMAPFSEKAAPVIIPHNSIQRMISVDHSADIHIFTIFSARILDKPVLYSCSPVSQIVFLFPVQHLVSGKSFPPVFVCSG